MPDLMDEFVKHAKSLHWVDRGCFLHDRGWYVDGDQWVSPHDGSRFKDSVSPMVVEMTLESEGRPTPVKGKYIS